MRPAKAVEVTQARTRAPKELLKRCIASKAMAKSESPICGRSGPSKETALACPSIFIDASRVVIYGATDGLSGAARTSMT